MGKSISKSSTRSAVVQHGTAVNRMEGNNSKAKPNQESKPSVIELHFLENVKQAKQLFHKYAATQSNTVITEGREKQNKRTPGCLITALGSEEEIYSVCADCGMFAAIFTAYSYHYKLRTSPDDWWVCVIKRVACAIDKNSQKESVRKTFVDHESKKTIVVVVKKILPSTTSITAGSLIK